MKTKATLPRLLFVVVPLFASCVVFAQPRADTTTAPFLDFKQFSTIAPADQLGFLDKLKWAGMKFANAPAAKRVVSLYEYGSDAIADVTCSTDRLRDHHALIVTRMVPTSSVIATLETYGDASSDPIKTNELITQLSDPQENTWIAKSELAKHLPHDPTLLDQVADPEPVWGELSFSNSCELREIAADLDYDAVTWHMVDDAKLRSLVPSERNDTTTAKFIVTDSFFPEQTEIKQYFAECVPASRRPYTRNSYCDVVR